MAAKTVKKPSERPGPVTEWSGPLAGHPGDIPNAVSSKIHVAARVCIEAAEAKRTAIQQDFLGRLEEVQHNADIERILRALIP